MAFIFVPLETISYTFRAVSLGVRLWVNMLAGHTLLHILTGGWGDGGGQVWDRGSGTAVGAGGSVGRRPGPTGACSSTTNTDAGIRPACRSGGRARGTLIPPAPTAVISRAGIPHGGVPVSMGRPFASLGQR